MLTHVDRRELRAWREAHGLSQTELAKLLAVDHNTVYRWEAGVRKGVPGVVLDLALAELDRRLAAVRGDESADAAP